MTSGVDSSQPTRPWSPDLAVMKPYTGDPNSLRRRRQRFWAMTGLGVFCLFYGMAFALFAPALIVVMVAPIAIMGLIAIWALPSARKAPVKSLERFLFALFITLVMWPNYLAIALPGLPWITLIRLTGFPLVFLLLVSLSTSADFRSRMAASISAAPIIWRLLVCFVVIQAFSIALSTEKGESIDKFIIAQLSWTAVFFVSSFAFTTRGVATRWATIMWIMGVGVSLIAVVEFREGHVPWAGHVPSFLKIADPVVALIMAGQSRAYSGVYRCQATFSTSIGLGEYLALTTPFVLHFAFHAERQLTRIGAALSVPLMFYAAYLSGARSGALGMLISIMLFGLLWAIVRWMSQARSLIAPFVTLAYPGIGAAVFGATLVIGNLRKMVWGGGEAAASTDARKIQYQMGIPMVWKNPLGHGIGRGAETLGFRQPGGLLSIDTYYLSVALEYGVIGFIVYYSMIGISVFLAFQSTIKTRVHDKESLLLLPAGISLVSFFVIKSVFSQQDNHPIIFMIMGMIASGIYKNNHEVRTPAKA